MILFLSRFRNQDSAQGALFSSHKRKAFGFLISFFTCIFLLPATKLGQGYVFTSVCDFVHRGLGLPHCMLGYTPGPEAGTPTLLGPGTPPGSRDPPAQCMLGVTGNKLECNLVLFEITQTEMQW